MPIHVSLSNAQETIVLMEGPKALFAILKTLERNIFNFIMSADHKDRYWLQIKTPIFFFYIVTMNAY